MTGRRPSWIFKRIKIDGHQLHTKCQYHAKLQENRSGHLWDLGADRQICCAIKTVKNDRQAAILDFFKNQNRQASTTHQVLIPCKISSKSAQPYRRTRRWHANCAIKTAENYRQAAILDFFKNQNRWAITTYQVPISCKITRKSVQPSLRTSGSQALTCKLCNKNSRKWPSDGHLGFFKKSKQTGFSYTPSANTMQNFK